MNIFPILTDITIKKEYVFTSIPRKSAIFQLLLRNTLVMASPFGRLLLQHYAPNLRNFSYIPGIMMLYGNVFGNTVGLCDTFFIDYAPIILGRNVGFSFRNMLITSNHDERAFSTVIARPIIIRDNVWITSNCTILGGVEIGENSIIGAGSVVTRSIPPNVVAAGNPCRPIRSRKSLCDTER
ncbi:MAG: DapH/DapD/GlmU-related protein [Chloroflexi bacterium]|nr:DapH/DapD/GlmU-related protein [Chloroflexota bacterium]